MLQTDRKDTERALRALKPAISRRPGIPALTGVLVESTGNGRATFTTTDLEMTVRLELEANGEAGRALIPFDTFSAAVKASGDTVTIEAGEASARIGGADIRLLPAEDFPYVAGELAYIGELDAAGFVRAGEAVCISASRDDARPVLTGVLIELSEDCRMVSTDSYRLHVAELAGSGDWKAIVPARAISAVTKSLGKRAAGSVTIRADEHSVRFRVPGGVEIRSRIIEGEFPNYRQLIPERGTGTAVKYDRAELEAALKAAGPYCGTQPVRLEVEHAVRMSVYAADIGAWSGELRSAEVFGEPVTVAFNPTYLGGAVKAAGDGATLELRDGLKPAAIYSAEGATVALVMPVRQPGQ